MADYNDYLNYLHHIDDTTAQEFKKREDELRHQIDVVREQCQKDIKDIKDKAAAEKAQLEADHNSAVKASTIKYKSSINKLKSQIKQLEESHEVELKRVNVEKDAAIKDLTDCLAQLKEMKKPAMERLAAKIKSFLLSLFMKHGSDTNDTMQVLEVEKLSENPNQSYSCRKCGNLLKPNALYCNKCGTKIAK